jgi:hypothetical protein
MNKQWSVEYTYKGMLFGHKKKWNSIAYYNVLTFILSEITLFWGNKSHEMTNVWFHLYKMYTIGKYI